MCCGPDLGPRNALQGHVLWPSSRRAHARHDGAAAAGRRGGGRTRRRGRRVQVPGLAGGVYALAVGEEGPLAGISGWMRMRQSPAT